MNFKHSVTHLVDQGVDVVQKKVILLGHSGIPLILTLLVLNFMVHYTMMFTIVICQNNGMTDILLINIQVNFYFFFFYLR